MAQNKKLNGAGWAALITLFTVLALCFGAAVAVMQSLPTVYIDSLDGTCRGVVVEPKEDHLTCADVQDMRYHAVYVAHGYIPEKSTK